MEFLVIPLIFIAIGIAIWLISDGPQALMAQRRRTAEANERTEKLRLKRAKLSLEERRLSQSSQEVPDTESL